MADLALPHSAIPDMIGSVFIFEYAEGDDRSNNVWNIGQFNVHLSFDRLEFRAIDDECAEPLPHVQTDVCSAGIEVFNICNLRDKIYGYFDRSERPLAFDIDVTGIEADNLLLNRFTIQEPQAAENKIIFVTETEPPFCNFAGILLNNIRFSKNEFGVPNIAHRLASRFRIYRRLVEQVPEITDEVSVAAPDAKVPLPDYVPLGEGLDGCESGFISENRKAPTILRTREKFDSKCGLKMYLLYKSEQADCKHDLERRLEYVTKLSREKYFGCLTCTCL